MDDLNSVPVTQIRVAEVVFDETTYVRWAVDRQHVRRLANALECGAVLPPIGVQARTKKVIWGVHRLYAYRAMGGDEAMVPAKMLDVDDDTALRLALDENSRHGLPYRQIDLRHAIALAERHHLGDEEIVRCLHVPPGRLMDLRAVRGVYRRGGGVASAAVSEVVPLKQSMSHLAGKVLTAAQYGVTGIAPGSSPVLLANQLAALIRADAIDRRNDRLRRALLILREVLGQMDLEEPWGETSGSDTARNQAVLSAR